MMSVGGEVTPEREMGGDTTPGMGGDTTPVGLTQILLGIKMKKTYAIDSAATNRWWRFKAMVSYFF
jgi:hypothetical protein